MAAAAAIVLVALAPTASARVAAVIYGAGLIALFTASALYHRWPGDPRWKPWLRRLDHSTIFIFIAASYTPVALLVLDGTLQTVVLISVWAGAAAGVALSLAWISAPRLVAGCYLALGWVAVVALPQLLTRSASRRSCCSPSAAAVLARRGRLRVAAPEPVAAHVRLPRGLPRARDRRRAGALHRDRGLGRPERRELSTAGSAGGSSGASQASCGSGTHSWSISSASLERHGRPRRPDARKTASVQTIRRPAQR